MKFSFTSNPTHTMLARGCEVFKLKHVGIGAFFSWAEEASATREWKTFGGSFGLQFYMFNILYFSHAFIAVNKSFFHHGVWLVFP